MFSAFSNINVLIMAHLKSLQKTILVTGLKRINPTYNNYSKRGCRSHRTLYKIQLKFTNRSAKFTPTNFLKSDIAYAVFRHYFYVST
jgi:hypothetical protein